MEPKKRGRGRPAGSGKQLSAAQRKKESLAKLLQNGGSRLSVDLSPEATEALKDGMKHSGIKRKKDYLERMLITTKASRSAQ